MNTLKPGSVSKIRKPFKKEDYQENVKSFLEACKAFRVPEDKLFTVDDLVEGTGIPQVINCLLAVGRRVSIPCSNARREESSLSFRYSSNSDVCIIFSDAL